MLTKLSYEVLVPKQNPSSIRFDIQRPSRYAVKVTLFYHAVCPNLPLQDLEIPISCFVDNIYFEQGYPAGCAQLCNDFWEARQRFPSYEMPLSRLISVSHAGRTRKCNQGLQNGHRASELQRRQPTKGSRLT